jgi:hypothetical protein
MEQKTHHRQNSVKSVKPLSEIVTNRIFLIPKEKANSFDPTTGEPCVFVGINGVNTNLPVGVPTPILYNVFCVLRDLGIVTYQDFYAEGGSFEPLR